MSSLRKTAVVAAACLATLAVQADDCIRYNGLTCVQCERGNYLSGGRCYDCPNDCDVCTDGATCTTCESGNYLSNGRCYDCPEDCDVCTSAGTCDRCEFGKNFNGVRCVRNGMNSASTVGVLGAASVLLAAALAVVA
ncbi:hypothetical protein, conserved [Angomonas deanei]|uniref:Uncharacterized protein n=1 Tax=Angomonas deanei TaxID=59799 RepID=A0A7G2CS29_9TRYP|nr:hypothetical protein, conserved [Angomonas deanei]